MASSTQWTWVWVSSGSWWWTGKPGMLQSMGLQRVGHDWATELNMFDLRPHGLQPSRLLCPRDFPGKNTGVGCHFFLQAIFPTQELNLHLQHWQAGSLPLSHEGCPSIHLYILHSYHLLLKSYLLDCPNILEKPTQIQDESRIRKGDTQFSEASVTWGQGSVLG